MASPAAVSVFGKPITQGTRAERAQAAAKNRNAGGKLDQLLQASLDFEKSAAAEEEVNSAVDHYNVHDNTLIGGFDHLNLDGGQFFCTGIEGFDRVNAVTTRNSAPFGGFDHLNSAGGQFFCKEIEGYDRVNAVTTRDLRAQFEAFPQLNSASGWTQLVGTNQVKSASPRVANPSGQRKRGPRTTPIRTTCIIYNATGDPITYVTKHDWEGQIAGRIPVVIQNGQYALLKHNGTASRNRKGSIGAVVFNVQNYTDCMIAWNNPKKTANGGKNTAYCKMDDPGHFNHCDWKKLYHVVKDCKSECETSMEGFTTNVSINADGSIPQYKAEFIYNAR